MLPPIRSVSLPTKSSTGELISVLFTPILHSNATHNLKFTHRSVALTLLLYFFPADGPEEVGSVTEVASGNDKGPETDIEAAAAGEVSV